MQLLGSSLTREVLREELTKSSETLKEEFHATNLGLKLDIGRICTAFEELSNLNARRLNDPMQPLFSTGTQNTVATTPTMGTTATRGSIVTTKTCDSDTEVVPVSSQDTRAGRVTINSRTTQHEFIGHNGSDDSQKPRSEEPRRRVSLRKNLVDKNASDGSCASALNLDSKLGELNRDRRTPTHLFHKRKSYNREENRGKRHSLLSKRLSVASKMKSMSLDVQEDPSERGYTYLGDGAALGSSHASQPATDIPRTTSDFGRATSVMFNEEDDVEIRCSVKSMEGEGDYGIAATDSTESAEITSTAGLKLPTESEVLKYKLDKRTSIQEPRSRSKRDGSGISMDLEFRLSGLGESLHDKLEEERSFLERVVSSAEFSYGVTILICLNAVAIGAQTDFMARNWTTAVPRTFRILEQGFCVVFTLEMTLRMLVGGCRFFSGPGARWNIFDTFIVGGQFFDELSCLLSEQRVYSTSEDILMLTRHTRILRVIRVFRLIRVLHHFGELRMLLVSITDALRSLFWIVLLLSFMMYILGCVLTQVVTNRKVELMTNNKEATSQLQKYYGTLDNSMFTFFETITEGIHWHEVMDPLIEHCSPWLKVLFFFYSAFVFFAVLNVVTGAFVESAIRTGTEDKQKLLMYQMRKLFANADADGSGTISWEEFQGQLDSPEMREYLKAVDLAPDEAGDLFNLLDADEMGEIDAEDLIDACLRLNGPAKSIDLASFMREYERQCKYWSVHASLMEQSLSLLVHMSEEQAVFLGGDLGETGIKSMAVKAALQRDGDMRKRSVNFNIV